MAQLTPDHVYVTPNGVTVNEKIIPDGTRWKDKAKAEKAGFHQGDLYKKNMKLSGGTGKVRKVTVHNTNDLENVEDDGEQYTRATYNENMGSARPHFYVDDLCAWQLLKAGTGQTPGDPAGDAEVGWHAGDGSVSDGGNMTTIGVEIIMNDLNVGHDAMAYDNGARLCAWLLFINGLNIEDLVTHAFWNAKKAGKTSDDVDQQCVTYVANGHWCPYYIFDAKNEAAAKVHWKAFKAVVGAYLEQLRNPPEPTVNPFVDVAENRYYYEAVMWGLANNICAGTDKAHFSPNTYATRAQVITFLYRALNKK